MSTDFQSVALPVELPGRCVQIARAGGAEQGRFWGKVDQSRGVDACWPWTASKDRDGYGRCSGSYGSRYAHRAAYLLSGGAVPSGMEIRHLCGTAGCCNPSHMRPGTHQENIADTVAMGRTTAGERNPAAKLDATSVARILELRKAGRTAKSIAAEFGVHIRTVFLIQSRKTWTHLPPADIRRLRALARQLVAGAITEAEAEARAVAL